MIFVDIKWLIVIFYGQIKWIIETQSYLHIWWSQLHKIVFLNSEWKREIFEMWIDNKKLKLFDLNRFNSKHAKFNKNWCSSHSDWMCIRTGTFLVILSCPKLAFFTSSEITIILYLIFVHFPFLLCKFLKIWAAKWYNLKIHDWKRRNLKIHDWHINFSSMRPCDRYLSQFDLNKIFQDSWCSISESQSHLLSWFQISFGIRDLNWQFRMCCEVPLRFCVKYMWNNCFWY